MDKNKVFYKNLSAGILWKFLSMLCVYLTIPFLLDYLGEKNYGIWITIFTIINTAYFMDLGIALGLKNEVTKAINNKNFTLAKTYISTAYFTILLISFAVMLFVVLLVLRFNMQAVFNIDFDEKTLKTVLIISAVLVLISVVLNIYKSIFISFQKSAQVELAMFLYQLLVFIQILVLPFFIKKSLIAVSIIYGFSNITIAIIFTSLFFYKNNIIQPSIKAFSYQKVQRIMGSGAQFFIIQISLIIILSTDNYLITRFISPEETTTYSLINKLFQTFLIASTLIFAPLWALYTTAYQRKDYMWIKKMFKKLNYLFIILIITLVAFYFLLPWVLKLWLHRTITYSPSLVIFTIVFVLIRVYGDIYMTFLNGIGKIKLQMWLYLFGAVINIPLSIYFIKILKMGSSGVILATCISLLALTLAMPIQSYKELHEK